MARYTIDFSTNARAVISELSRVNEAITKVARTGKSVKLEIDTGSLRTSFDATFKALDKQIANIERRLSGLSIGSRKFQETATGLGVAQGLRERGGLQARAIQLGAQSGAFDEGSIIRLRKQIEAAQIEASQISPNTQPWIDLQKQIGNLNAQLRQTDRLAENVQLSEQLGAFAPRSLNQLEAKLIVLRNRAREISPDAAEWKKLNKEIVQIEQNIQKQTQRPLTRGQRLGAAGGAFLYGGGLSGGFGSAAGGIAGGLFGGVPGAFTGAAIGQAVDNLTGITSAITEQAASLRRYQAGLASASTGLQDYLESVREVEDISNRLLIPIGEATRKFTQLKASTVSLGFDTKTTGDIFEGTTAAVLRAGGSLEDVDGAMRAVVQVFSKGKLTAEELRGQLAERLPGAVVDFAKSAGMSVQELDAAFESGTTSIDDFVKFLRSKKDETSDYVDELATRSEYAGARMSKAFEKLQLSIGASLQPAGAAFQDFITRSINGADKLIRKLIELGAIQPGPDFYRSQALAGANGGVAGLEQQLLAAGARETAARQTAASAGLGFIADFLPDVADASKQAKILEEALTSIRKDAKLTKERVAQINKEAQKEQGAQKFLDAIEAREEGLAKAREQYEDDIAEARKNAIKQAEALERKYQDSRVQAERELARIRRELEAEVSNESFLRRRIAGEDPELLEAEKQAAEIVRQYTEEKISNEERAQDEQIQIARDLEDFKKANSEAINQAAERYAKKVGEIQQAYARTVGKLIEDGSGKGAQRLAAAGKILAADIARATAQQAVVAATGTVVIPRGGGKYEAAGKTFTEAGLYDAARKTSAAAETAVRAYVKATKDFEDANKQLTTAARASIGTVAAPSIAPVSTSDIYAPVEEKAKALSNTNNQIKEENDNLSEQKTLVNGLLELFAKQTDEGNRLSIDLEKQANQYQYQVDLLNGGLVPGLAKAGSEADLLFQKQRDQARRAELSFLAEVAKVKNAEERKKLEGFITEEYKTQLDIINKSQAAYEKGQRALIDTEARLEAANLRAQQRTLGGGLRAGFLGEAAGAFEQQIQQGASIEAATEVAKAAQELDLAKTAADGLQSSIEGIGTSFADSLTEVITGAQTAQAALGNLFRNIAQSFARLATELIAKYLILKAVGVIASFFNPGANAVGGGDSVAQLNQGFQQYPLLTNANGNVLRGGFQAFANGGVVTGPTLGLVGEGRFNEAVVPLPDGRRIPVELTGGSGNNISTNIVVNVNNGQASSQINGGGGQSLGREIEGAVRSVILKESRPGGIIYNQR